MFCQTAIRKLPSRVLKYFIVLLQKHLKLFQFTFGSNNTARKNFFSVREARLSIPKGRVVFFNNRYSLISVHCNLLQMLCCATQNFRKTERSYIFRHCHDNHRKLSEASSQKQSLKTCFGNVSFVFISHKRTLPGSVVSVFASRQKTQRNTVNRRNDRERLPFLHVSVVSRALQGHEILLKVSFSSSFS